MRIIPKHAEKGFVSRLMKNGQKSIRLNPINSETSLPMNLNQSETKFSISINLNHPELALIQPEFSIRIHPNKSKVGVIQIDLNWKFGFGFIRIDVSELIGLSRIDFLPFFIKRDTKIFSDRFGIIRIGSDTGIGMNQNNSD